MIRWLCIKRGVTIELESISIDFVAEVLNRLKILLIPGKYLCRHCVLNLESKISTVAEGGNVELVTANTVCAKQINVDFVMKVINSKNLPAVQNEESLQVTVGGNENLSTQPFHENSETPSDSQMTSSESFSNTQIDSDEINDCLRVLNLSPLHCRIERSF